MINDTYWRKRCAGCLILAEDTRQFLVPFRSSKVMDPDQWGAWGGGIDGGEDPTIALRRELREECGYDGPASFRPMLIFKDHENSGLEYQNYLCIVPFKFEPVLNWENSDARWVTLAELLALDDIHVGLYTLFRDQLSLDVLKYYSEKPMKRLNASTRLQEVTAADNKQVDALKNRVKELLGPWSKTKQEVQGVEDFLWYTPLFNAKLTVCDYDKITMSLKVVWSHDLRDNLPIPVIQNGGFHIQEMPLKAFSGMLDSELRSLKASKKQLEEIQECVEFWDKLLTDM